MSDLFPNDERPLTPKNALADLDYLRDKGYWDRHSLLEFTRHHWVPMTDEHLRMHLAITGKFSKKGRPRQFALALREARIGLEAALSLDLKLTEDYR